MNGADAASEKQARRPSRRTLVLFLLLVAVVTIVLCPQLRSSVGAWLWNKKGLGGNPCAQAATCCSRLKQLGLACNMYAMDYDGHFPERLSLLYPSYLSDLEIYVCPATRDRVSTKDEIDGNSSYQYFGASLTEDDDPNAVLAKDRHFHERHVHGGRVDRPLLFSDGRVESEFRAVGSDR